MNMRRLCYVILCGILSFCICGCESNVDSREEGNGFSAITDSCLSYFSSARQYQDSARYQEALADYKRCLAMASTPSDDSETDTLVMTVVNAAMQMMNTYQSMTKPDECAACLDSLLSHSSPFIRKYCMRDLLSIAGYAYSRTDDREKDAVESVDKALATESYLNTPKLLFKDYAYAAAVLYNIPGRQNDVIRYLNVAIDNAEKADNPSGTQYAVSILGMAYRREGKINEAIALFERSVDIAKRKNDILGEAWSYTAMVEMLIYWKLHEEANLYATRGVELIEKSDSKIKQKNPMVFGQIYLYKGIVMKDMGHLDSCSYYLDKASQMVKTLPYNSGQVDIDIIRGEMFTMGTNADSLSKGEKMLLAAQLQATPRNKAVASFDLAQLAFKRGDDRKAEQLLDTVYAISRQLPASLCITGAYEKGLSHYLKTGNLLMVSKFAEAYLGEQQNTVDKVTVPKLAEVLMNYNFERKRMQMELANAKMSERMVTMGAIIILLLVVVVVIAIVFIYNRRLYKTRSRLAQEQLTRLSAELDITLDRLHVERNNASAMKNRLETYNEMKQQASIIPEGENNDKWEMAFRRRFIMVYPEFLHNLRREIPNIGTRMELFCMLIALDQNTSQVSDVLNVNANSVKMMRYRVRQRFNLGPDDSLEERIKALL